MNPNNPNFRTNDEWFELCGKLQRELKDRDAQIKELREALEFYASCALESAFEPGVNGGNWERLGTRARQALEDAKR